MGAKQSKRSVDISGKEAESAGEVAAAGAGGEGRVEPLADADALKPQLNGDAHIHEQTDKEKQLDSGTPENEKDATTEKEGKQEESEKEEVALSPVTNGDSGELKTENGDSAPTPEESKKPKKEKVKKKWSLRSISFSRKDKPKQEKKQKEEEPKTNGEPEKLPEEATEATAEPATNDVAEVKSETEVKEEKAPETPVTEPITNGSNTPESPKVEIPPVEKVAPEAVPEPAKIDTIAESEPEKLPMNGLSLEEPKSDGPEVEHTEESKFKESPAESTETVPAIEIPVQKEVCVDQMPLIESTPPPLPANPPPSSVVSFAATTMAPDLTDASLANTAETAISSPPVLDTKIDLPKECPTESPHPDVTNNEADVPCSLIKPIQEVVEISKDIKNENIATSVTVVENIVASEAVEDELKTDLNDVKNEIVNGIESEHIEKPIEVNYNNSIGELQSDISLLTEELLPSPDDNIIKDTSEKTETIAQEIRLYSDIQITNSNFSNGDVVNGIDKEIINGNEEIVQENIKIKAVDTLGNFVETIEFNGNINDADTQMKEEMSGREHSPEESIAKATSLEESLPPSPSEAEAEAGAAEASDSFPAPPSECRSPSEGSPEPEPEHEVPSSPSPPSPPSPQEPIAVSDKIAELIPEVPVVPELKTETLQETSDVALVN